MVSGHRCVMPGAGVGRPLGNEAEVVAQPLSLASRGRALSVRVGAVGCPPRRLEPRGSFLLSNSAERPPAPAPPAEPALASSLSAASRANRKRAFRPWRRAVSPGAVGTRGPLPEHQQPPHAWVWPPWVGSECLRPPGLSAWTVRLPAWTGGEKRYDAFLTSPGLSRGHRLSRWTPSRGPHLKGQAGRQTSRPR